MQVEAINFIERVVKEEGIECGYTRLDGEAGTGVRAGLGAEGGAGVGVVGGWARGGGLKHIS